MTAQEAAQEVEDARNDLIKMIVGYVFEEEERNQYDAFQHYIDGQTDSVVIDTLIAVQRESKFFK